MTEFSDLTVYGSEGLVKRLEDFQKKLSTPPVPEILQATPDNKAVYLPISFVENQLREDFMGLVQFEIVSERREINEYIVVARIKVFHPVAGQWLTFDGIGSGAIMQDSGTSLDQFTIAKKKNALEMGAPKVYAEAIKNAAKKIGKKYGADLNRKFEDDYTMSYTGDFLKDILDSELGMCATYDEIDMLITKYSDEITAIGKKSRGEYVHIVSKHKQRIKNESNGE